MARDDGGRQGKTRARRDWAFVADALMRENVPKKHMNGANAEALRTP